MVPSTTRALELPLAPELTAPAGDVRPYVVVDVFTTTALEGNQLGVFTDAREFDDATMQGLARELNVAETVFVLPPERDGDVRVRIFTPRNELPFAGHPVLGTGFVVASVSGRDTALLETGAGTVTVEVERRHGQVVFGRFTRPAPSWEPYEPHTDLIAALGIESSVLPVEAYLNGPRHVYVALDSQDAVASLQPDLAALADLSQTGVNCFAGSGRRWTTRMFAPGMGVPEDPATGSAAGPLAMHLVRHGRIALGQEIEIHQGQQIGRPSVLHARAHGHGQTVESVEVGGSAVVVARGSFRLA